MIGQNVNTSRMSIRPPAVAGTFYPGNAAQLNHMLDEYLGAKSEKIKPPKAIIAPHAGYIYSGPVAASVYSNIEQLRTQVKRVILLGPAHRVYVEGIALPTNTHFATPLGNVKIDKESLNKIANYPFVDFFDAAHTQEHSLEVHIPFLQKVLDDFVLVPMVVGNVSPENVATVLEQLWGGDETLIVISSDLSHYLDYDTASEVDYATTRLIQAFDYKHISPEQACGCMPMRGLLKLAQEKNMQIKTLDLRNSGDTAGSMDRVVGYGAYALFDHEQSQEKILNDENKTIVFDVIRKSIEQGLETGKAYKPDISNFPEVLQNQYAVFITLKINDQLRGCIGTTEATRPLIDAVAYYAFAAAFSDPRFTALTKEEYPDVDISLSILTPAVNFPFTDENDLINQLRPGIDGLIIEKGNKRATFLPVVWESIQHPRQFLDELKRKAGMNTSDMPDKAWRYTAEYYY